MAKKDDRPVDEGLASLKGKDEATALQWWTQRFGLVAAIPVDTARVGALIPALRELSGLPAEERKRLTRARIQAFGSLPSEQREPIARARKMAFDHDRALLEDDERLVQELLPTLPDAAAAYPRS